MNLGQQLGNHRQMILSTLLQTLDPELGTLKDIFGALALISTTINASVELLEILVDTSKTSLNPLVHSLDLVVKILVIVVHPSQRLSLRVDSPDMVVLDLLNLTSY
jgi:hypothetical protein